MMNKTEAQQVVSLMTDLFPEVSGRPAEKPTYEDIVAAVTTIGELSLAKVDLLSSGVQTDDLSVSKESLSTSWNPVHGTLVVIRLRELEDGTIRRDQHVFRLEPR